MKKFDDEFSEVSANFGALSVNVPFIKLQSSDGEMFQVDLDTAKCSGTIKDMIENCSPEEETVPLPNVNAAILRKVIVWAEHHKDDVETKPINEGEAMRTDNIEPWDIEFFQVDQGTLFELIMAANYLSIQGLLELSCKTVANMIRGKSPEDIRQIFNIKNDFSAAEEAQIRKENDWYEDK